MNESHTILKCHNDESSLLPVEFTNVCTHHAQRLLGQYWTTDWILWCELLNHTKCLPMQRMLTESPIVGLIMSSTALLPTIRAMIDNDNTIEE